MARSLEKINSVSINEVPSSNVQRWDYNSDGTILYAGHAPKGAAATEDVWTIFKYTNTSGVWTGTLPTLKETALGPWSERTSLEYS